MTQARTVAEVIGRLEAIDAALPRADGVGCFNRMYLTVTKLVGERITAGFFADPAAMELLDVTFANIYLAAVAADAASRRPARAWRPLFARRTDKRVVSLQFAIAGMNAHINHDLPVAVVATCRELGQAPDEGTFRDDYLRVNELLRQVEQEVRVSFLSDVVLGVDTEVGPALDLVGNWSIENARDAAWVNAEVLWQLRDIGFVRDGFLRTLAGSVGLASATLLAPVLPRPLVPAA